MAVVYRSEKKKIMRSQIHLIQKVISILSRVEEVLLSMDVADPSRAYTDMILEETDSEAEWRSKV